MAAINPVADLSIDGEVAVITINSPPVNALSQPVRDGLNQAVKQADANSAAKAIVIICDGRTFIAGADIAEFGKPPAAPPLSKSSTRWKTRQSRSSRRSTARRSGADSKSR